MSGFRTEPVYASTNGVAGVATNASFTGTWINIEDVSSIGFQVIMAGTSSPVAAWGADITNQDNPNRESDSSFVTPLTLTSDMTAQNPAGGGTAVNYLFQFEPCPRAKWMRFKYVYTSGGSATATSMYITYNHLSLRA